MRSDGAFVDEMRWAEAWPPAVWSSRLWAFLQVAKSAKSSQGHVTVGYSVVSPDWEPKLFPQVCHSLIVTVIATPDIVTLAHTQIARSFSQNQLAMSAPQSDRDPPGRPTSAKR